MKQRPFYSEYFSRVRRRLKAGAEEYQDKSLEARPLPEVIDELRQELEDIGGWAAIVHHRLTKWLNRLERDR